ncbi:hypothetical protein Clacol_004086 [Clathrus columnatus]|uniref:Uncharacterized protein n=1 Tax=Clathrus columnatus TaxID=1419009 RepID=A0AAV5A873_9AGAM|nr:hypothetical protein Clacol_004086 [Clathrus columnatus]
MFTITQFVSLSLLTLGVIHAFPVTPNEALQIPDLAFENLAAKPSGPHIFSQAKSPAMKRADLFPPEVLNFGWPNENLPGIDRDGGTDLHLFPTPGR